MSLHHLAAHIQSQGRKGDTGLVHMTPGEIGALQKLAISRGGSLSINPKTGLPEAGFLKDMLPMLVGLAAAPFTGGMSLAAAMALSGGLAFGTSMAVGNSFKKSLFTGLTSGAGAGLGAAAGAAGASAGASGQVVGQGLGQAAGQGVGQAVGQGVGQAVGQGVARAAPQALSQGAMRTAGVGAAEGLGSTLSTAAPRIFSAEAAQLAQQGAQSGLAPRIFSAEAAQLAQPGRIFAGAVPRQGVSTYTGTGGQAATREAFEQGLTPSQLARVNTSSYVAKPIEPLPANYGPASYGGTQTPAQTGAEIYKAASPLDRPGHIAKGVGELFTEPGVGKQFAKDNWGKLASAGIGGIGMNMSGSEGIAPPPAQKSDYAGPYLPTERTTQFPIGPTPWTDTSERSYFSNVNPYPGYIKAAAGGLMGVAGDGSYDDEGRYDGYAEGGEVAPPMMLTPDMSAIQSYIQGINQQKPQVPEILRQLQAQRATQPQAQQPTQPQAQRATQPQSQTGGGERDYGFKPITVQQAPPAGSAGNAVSPVGAKGGTQTGQSASSDPYAAYRPQNIDTTAPGAKTKSTTQYTNLNNRVYNPDTQQMEVPMAMGGLTSLASGGSYLDGPGDGLSDSIPATIGDGQPARLADGEFVISADVVSAIGAGSSKAGAKKLHAMMDRVRQSAHGTKKQVKKINDKEVLPA